MTQASGAFHHLRRTGASMKIILMSDTHFGFGSGTERWDDSFLTFEEGLSQEADAFLVAGDVFDTRIPTQETFSRVMELLFALKGRKSDVTVNGKEHGVPVIAIHGNHERRVRGLVNPVEALAKGGLLKHVHCSTALLEKGEEKVAVHGLSAVPHQYLSTVLQEWNPQPLPGAYNILMFHQNLKGFVRSNEGIPKTSLPQGFDLYLCGDIHEQHQSTVHGKPLILPGSTVATQINKDACNPRSFVTIDTVTGSIAFVPFRNQRKVFYLETSKKEETHQLVAEALEGEHTYKPIIKIVSPEPIEHMSGEAIFMLTQKKDLPAISFKEQTQSVQQSGKQTLATKLKEAGLDPQRFGEVFELLSHKKPEQAFALLKTETKKDV